MICATVQNGQRIATVTELLRQMEGTTDKHLLSTFRTTAAHIAACLQTPVDALTIDVLTDVAPALSAYLHQRRYKPSSVRSYCKFAGMIVVRAKQLGWMPKESEVIDAWRPILAAVSKHGCAGIVRYAVKNNIHPHNFSERHLTAWAETMVARGRSYGTAQLYIALFRRFLRNERMYEAVPQVRLPNSSRQYGIPLRDFPSELRGQVERLLAWKQAEFAPQRPHKCRNREITIQGLRELIQRLYGFAMRVQPTLGTCDRAPSISNLAELVTEERLTAFVGWLINERRVLNGTAAGEVATLYAAVKYFPETSDRNFSWCSDLLRQISPDPKSGLEERKLRKYLAYDVIAGIPNKIAADRRQLPKDNGKKMALMVRDELLIRWLTILPWRQRNIRQCRLGVNLFKRELPPMGSIRLPKWVEECLRINPLETFWQFDFREAETKNKERVRAVLPRQLIPLLEEYLEDHRPVLLNGRDSDHLFLNGIGGSLDSEAVDDLIADITLRYGKKRVTPHLFRDIFAYKWLDQNPTDYLTLSKHLWHKDIKTTLRCYGSKFDTSHAACQIENWLDACNEANQ